MYFILKGANFADSKLGKITVVEGQIGTGGTTIDPNAEYTLTVQPTPSDATVTLTATGYTQSGNSIKVKRGTQVTIKLEKTGYVSRTFTKTVYGDSTATYEIYAESVKTYTLTINPNPANATVTLNGAETKSITVPKNSRVTWVVSASGYQSQTDVWLATKNDTLNITLVSDGSGGGNTPVNPPSGGGVTWYINSLDAVAATGKDITGGTFFTGSSIAPVAFDNTFNAKLVGKTIDTVEFVPEKAGKITFGVYNTTTYAYTEKASITIAEADLNTRKIYTFTPFTVSSGELFTFYKSGDVGCMSYYLAKDVSGVDYCRGLQTKCNGAAPTAFNYDIITLINVGTSSGSGGNVTPETPSGNTTWYISSLKQLQDSGNDIAANRVELAPNSGYHWAFKQFNSKLAGKTINTIELMPCKSGTFTVGIFDTSSNTVTDKRSITINAADVNTVKTYTFSNLTIPSGKYFVWNCSGKGTTSGEAAGYYVLKDKLDPLAVETSQWYQAKSSGLTAFGDYQLAFVANIGYTA